MRYFLGLKRNENDEIEINCLKESNLPPAMLEVIEEDLKKKGVKLIRISKELYDEIDSV
ncbi:hypothetical protein HNP93_000975 [Methanococcus maripaludis]|uniref:Uncharacterized protein n=1 Tax=Methanococcus maripaludis TaxID=39152 RepID=A0A7J9P679_METMI|nr:hypothetical protein [Methanococcus maripaludis]MBA2858274.1 hypothetical protein [Methanococcus maripaludis]